VNRVGLAVVGCGNITAERHLPAIVSEVPELELIALCNRTETRLHLLGDQYRVPVANRYTDFKKLFERDDIHGILIAASPAANFEIVQGAAQAGKHIFVEKPMAETAEQARSMVQWVERAGIRFQVGFNKRYYYAYRKALELIRNGYIGNPTGISGRFWFSASRRAMAPRKQVVVQNGIHFLDLVQFFMGRASEVMAREQVLENRTTVTAAITFASGAVGNVLLSNFGSWSYPNERVDIVGSNGSCLSAENGRKVVLFVENKPGMHFEQTISGHWITGHEEAGFSLQLKAFAHSILNDESTDVGVTDGLMSLLLADAIQASLETRQPTTVSPH
jgi:predicted dehydrogenase